MAKLTTVMLSGILLVAVLLAGCDSDSGDRSDAVLTGRWSVSQATIKDVTTPTASLGTVDLILNDDGTFQVDGTLMGGDPLSCSGTYTTDGGNRIAFTVHDESASSAVTLPVTATFEFDSDTLDIRTDTAMTVLETAVSAVFLVR
jgi:hypothetical protein